MVGQCVVECSLETGRWVAEEPHEVAQASAFAGARSSRLRHQAAAAAGALQRTRRGAASTGGAVAQGVFAQGGLDFCICQAGYGFQGSGPNTQDQ